MQVTRIEGSALPETRPIEDAYFLILPGEQTLGAQLLKGTVDVHGRESQRLAQFHLRDRQRESIIVNKVRDRKARVQFADEVSELLGSCAARGDEPLAMDGAVDEGH